jgi:hypothetical protein
MSVVLTAGLYTQTFVVDASGGGKRDAHSFEHHNRVTGISVYQVRRQTRAESICTSTRSIHFRPRAARAGPRQTSHTTHAASAYSARAGGEPSVMSAANLDKLGSERLGASVTGRIRPSRSSI